MTTWNVRIVHSEDEDGHNFSFIECYYDANSNVIGWHNYELGGESLHDLHGQLQRLLFKVTEAIALRRAETGRGSGVIESADLPFDTESRVFNLDAEIEARPDPQGSEGEW